MTSYRITPEGRTAYNKQIIEGSWTSYVEVPFRITNYTILEYLDEIWPSGATAASITMNAKRILSNVSKSSLISKVLTKAADTKNIVKAIEELKRAGHIEWSTEET